MSEIQINSAKKLKIEKEKDQLIIDGKVVSMELVKSGEKSYTILDGNKIHSAELLELSGNEMVLSVNGKSISLLLVDPIDKVLKKLGMKTGSSTSVKEVKAPMPGTILSVPVSNGDKISKGDSLLILEAMKMENVIKSPRDGEIANVLVAEGANVEKNQVLITFD